MATGCRALNETEIDNIKRLMKNQRDRTLFVLGLRTGLRISELLSIRVGDVYKFNKVVDRIKLYKNQVKGKSESKEIMLHRDAITEIDSLIRSLDYIDPQDFLFKSRNGLNKALSRMQAWAILKDVTNSLELTGKIATHSLRKSFSWSFYEKSGHDLRMLQKALGHKFIETTVKYLDPEQKEVDKVIMEMN